MKKSKGWVFLGFNTRFIVYPSLYNGKHLVIPCLYFLLYWSWFSCEVSSENLCNYTNLLYSGFCLWSACGFSLIKKFST